MNAAQVNQAKLESALNTLFPSERVVKNARKEVAIKNPVNGEYLEVDLWYPELKLCFEYQDDYHYHPTWYCQIPLPLVQAKDSLKRDLLLQRGETIIPVPCWWDGTVTSLQATINFHRPELFLPVGDMISANPSLDFFPVTIVPKNMKLMLASFPSSQEQVSVSLQNPWWLGEKYDGVRCYWNPSEKQMYSRHGLTIGLQPLNPSSFGSIVLDGEIWCGRGLFLESQTLVSASSYKVDWSLLRIVCFDEASQQMCESPFEERYSLLLSHFAPAHPIVIIATRLLCTAPATLTTSLQQVVEGGGEGVILRKPQSVYERGRTTSLLKLKASRADQEALVVHVEEDGALILQLPDGTHFVAEKSDCVLHRRAMRGDVVTFTHDFVTRQATQDPATHRNAARDAASHREAARDDAETHDLSASARDNMQSVPSNPVIFRIRDDLSWEDVLRNSGHPVRHFLNEAHQKMERNAPRPRGYWSYDKGKNMRSHLEAIARRHGFDPLVAENWYNVSRQEFVQHREVRTLISYYGASLTKALVDLFPELNLDVSKFTTTPMNFFEGVKNRRELYEKFARAKGGDPLNPQFWYSLNFRDFRKLKGGRGTMEYYGGYSSSVIHLFPELHLEKSKLVKRSEGTLDLRKVKKMFNEFAKVQGIDPLVAANWYNISNLSFSNFKDYIALVRYRKIRQIVKKYFKGKFSSCVAQIYPDIGIQKSKFITASYKHLSWKEKCEEEKWREEHRKAEEKRGEEGKERGGVGKKQRGERASGVEKQRGRGRKEREERRAVLVEFAKSNQFDPFVAENWYKASRKKFLQHTGGRNVMSFYDNSFVEAVVDLLPELNLEKSKFASTPQNFWKAEKNRRELFERYAKEKGEDPLNPKFWYNFSAKEFRKFKGVRAVMEYFGGFVESVTRLFPELRLEKSKFVNRIGNSEQSPLDPSALRTLLDSFAEGHGFDSLVPENWYNIANLSQFADYETEKRYKKIQQTIKKYYGSKFSKCLILAYPDIGLVKSRFIEAPYKQSHFREKEVGQEPEKEEIIKENKGNRGKKERKAVLLDFAKASNFDPLEPDPWYNVSRQKLLQHVGGRGVLKYYNNSMVEAVIDLFPELRLEKSKFSSIPQNFWKSEKNRRELFERYARAKGGDPLNPHFWYALSANELRKFKGMRTALEYHKNYADSVSQLFPEIHFDQRKFHR